MGELNDASPISLVGQRREGGRGKEGEGRSGNRGRFASLALGRVDAAVGGGPLFYGRRLNTRSNPLGRNSPIFVAIGQNPAEFFLETGTADPIRPTGRILNF